MIYLNKKVKYLEVAIKEFNDLPLNVRVKFNNLFEIFESGSELDKVLFKKLVNTELFEFRLRDNKVAYRAIGSFWKNDFIILLVFQKQSQKTPNQILKLAQKRYKSLF